MNNIDKKPIFNELCSFYTGGICHKNLFIFLDPNNYQVVVYDKCLIKQGEIKTEKYQSITENKEECYFILTKMDDVNYLYKTTYDFLEFDSIELQISNKYKETINDIFYDSKEKSIMIVTNNFIYTVTLDGYFIKELAGPPTPSNNMMIQNLNGCCMRNYNQLKPIFQYTAIGSCDYLYVAYKEKENTYLSIMGEANCLSEQICFGKNIKIVSIFVCRGKLYLLVIKNNQYNYLYETDICCRQCEEKCLPCCKEHQEHCHHHCQDPAACLLESIALVETSLSHILNAEGEKIQKAIADNASICELLEINDSVSESIFNVTMLEHALQKKIEKTLKYDKCHTDCHDCRD